jgi:hypothetical protein
MKGLDLSGSDLTNANLTDADLTGANLTGAILRGASLEGANLTDVNLTSAHLDDSNQGSTDLSSANLSGVVLTDATLGGADMEYTDLSGVNFGGLDVSTVKFGPTVKTGTHKGVQTSFRGATIRSDFKPAGVDLTGVRRVTVKTKTPRRKGLGVVPTVTCGSSDLSQLTSVVYVSAAGTDSAGCGTTHANACKTISQGIQNCGASGCGVLVDFGQYPQTSTLAVRNGVSVYGGCVGSAPGNYYSLITAPASGAAAVSAQSVGTATTWQNFKISASPALGTNGAPSVAASVASSSALSFVNCEFYAATGATGAQGSTPAAGTGGGAGNGTTGGTVSACAGTTGGAGSVQQTVSLDWWNGVCTPSCSANGCYGYGGQPGTTGNWSGGGQPGGGNCAGAACPVSAPGQGNTGGGGTTASCGSPGQPSTNLIGAFSGGAWSGSAGGSGSPGGNGGGGGGGGAGGYQCGYCFGYIQEPGNTGGGGGAGGCGGASGPGGKQGGASFAIVNSASTLTVTSSRVVGNQGGIGGQGGGGSNGGGGGVGAAGATGGRGAQGGPGGTGGGGGGAGGAAGGNGGPSVLIALVGASTVTDTSTSYYLGSSGNPGQGGGGGVAPGGSCTGTTGLTGSLGTAAKTVQY